MAIFLGSRTSGHSVPIILLHRSFHTRSKLETPQQQIVAYLKDYGIPESKQPQVSLLFAESMLLELQGVVEQWQTMLVSMQQTEEEIRRAVTQSN